MKGNQNEIDKRQKRGNKGRIRIYLLERVDVGMLSDLAASIWFQHRMAVIS